MANVLVIYYTIDDFPPRQNLYDHLYSLERYSNHRFYYVNLAVRAVSATLLKSVTFDLVIFHTYFLACRWWSVFENQALRRAQPLKGIACPKAILPQDEYYRADFLCQFIRDFNVTHVFSVAAESEWAKMYQGIDRTQVRFHRVMTGYLDERLLARLVRRSQEQAERDIVIGYRARNLLPWYGRHGAHKSRIADLFQHEGEKHHIRTDISTREIDTILGNAWYDFLLRSKYTIGVEGGASVLDWDGSIMIRSQAYIKQHPSATFEEVEEACFPGHDGLLDLRALSPRHLEACATRTCQVLVEGDYDGVLVPNVHYIELKRDYSNIDDVMTRLVRDDERQTITQQAYHDIVASERYTYRQFVIFLLDKTLGSAAEKTHGAADSPRHLLAYRYARAADWASWGVVAVAAKGFLALKLVARSRYGARLRNVSSRMRHRLRAIRSGQR